MNVECWILNIEYWILNFEYWILHKLYSGTFFSMSQGSTLTAWQRTSMTFETFLVPICCQMTFDNFSIEIYFKHHETSFLFQFYLTGDTGTIFIIFWVVGCMSGAWNAFYWHWLLEICCRWLYLCMYLVCLWSYIFVPIIDIYTVLFVHVLLDLNYYFIFYWHWLHCSWFAKIGTMKFGTPVLWKMY